MKAEIRQSSSQQRQPSSAALSEFFSPQTSVDADSAASAPDFSALYQQFPFSVIVYDMEGRVVIANKAFLKQWEITIDHFPPGYSVLHDPQLKKAGILALIRRAFNGDCVVLPPLRYESSLFSDAFVEPRWFQGTLSPIVDANRNVVHVMHLYTDVSAQVLEELAHEARGERENRLLREMLESSLDFHALYEQLPFSAIVFDLKGKVLMANLAYTRDWGFTVDQLPPAYSILHDPQLEAAGVLPIIELAFAGEVVKLPPLQYELRHLVAGDQGETWFEATLYPARDGNGIVRQVVMIYTDVTREIEAKVAAAAQAGREERRMRAILECTTDCVIHFDRNWNTTFLNKPAMDLISAGRDLIGTNFWKEFPEATHNRMCTEYHKAMDERVPVEFEEYYPGQLNKWFHIRAFPTAEGIAVFFQDITEHRRSEKAHRDNEKLVLVGRLAASIAHEINNPLEAVANLLHLLQGETGMPATAREFVEIAQQEVSRVALITLNTLKFFRQPSHPAPASLLEVVASVLSLFQGRVRPSGIRIVTRYRAHAEFTCFAAELRQVFANFIANALDATSAGGHIHLRIRPASMAVCGEPGILITIADTGTGMSAHTLAHLYEAFFTTRDVSGTGLGLWISMELIKKHRGRVRVRSRQAASGLHGDTSSSLPSGTVFQITFPYQNNLEASSPA